MSFVSFEASPRCCNNINYILIISPAPDIREARALQPIVSLSTSRGLTPAVAAVTQSTAPSCSLTPMVAAATQSVALQPAVRGTPTDIAIQPTTMEPVAQPAAMEPVAQPAAACTPSAITTTMSTMSTATEFSITPTLTTAAMPRTAVTPSTTTAATTVPATSPTTLPSPATTAAPAPSPTPPATKDSEILEDSMDVDITSSNKTSEVSLSTHVLIPVQWIKTWFEFFGGLEFEDPWKNIVAMWIKLEESLGFSDSSVCCMLYCA